MGFGILKKTLIFLMLSSMITSTLVGCNGSEDPLAKLSKEELIAMINSRDAELEKSYTTIEDLQEKVTGIIGTEENTAGITEFTDNSGRLTLQSVEDTISLPVPFEYPASTQTYNASTIALTDNVYIKPSYNWTVCLSGTQIDFYHSGSKISGLIKVGSRDKTQKAIQVSELSNTILAFFEEMPQTTVSTSKVYLNENWLGTDASATTFIDEEDTRIRCGMVGIGDINITYLFTYKGQVDTGKDELIITLLQTMNVYGQEFRIE